MIIFDDILVRLMQDCPKDYNKVTKWLTDPTVLEYFEGRDSQLNFDRVVEKYKMK